jgi:hypothetical protein
MEATSPIIKYFWIHAYYTLNGLFKSLIFDNTKNTNMLANPNVHLKIIPLITNDIETSYSYKEILKTICNLIVLTLH